MKLNIDSLKKEPGVIVDEAHEWGYQIRLVNNEKYCGKLLILTNGVHGSNHRHGHKDETFIVLKGEVFVKSGGTVVLLKPGDHVRTSPGVAHEMWAKTTPSVIMEVSTTDDDLDCERIAGE